VATEFQAPVTYAGVSALPLGVAQETDAWNYIGDLQVIREMNLKPHLSKRSMFSNKSG